MLLRLAAPDLHNGRVRISATVTLGRTSPSELVFNILVDNFSLYPLSGGDELATRLDGEIFILSLPGSTQNKQISFWMPQEALEEAAYYPSLQDWAADLLSFQIQPANQNAQPYTTSTTWKSN